MLILVVSSVITNHPFETVLLWTTDLEKSITRIKFYIIRTSGSSAEAFCDAHPWADHLAKLEVMVLTEQGLERAGLGLSQGEKFSVLLVYSAIAIATVFGFAASLIVGASFARLAALGILAYTLFPVYRFFNRHTRRPEMASALSILLALLLMVLPSFFLVSELVQQVSGAYSNFQAENIQRVADYLSGLTGNRIDF